jgi:hypothetical protein
MKRHCESVDLFGILNAVQAVAPSHVPMCYTRP